jgi:glyoxylase-like metal-dependent hydrolase (beta-lactamase superfamily II)
MAIRVPWAQVLVCGDYLSPVEIPMLSPAGSVAEYRATLERLRPLLLSAEWVIPGHGRPERPEAASKRLEEDLGYLAALEEHGAEAELPAGRRNAAQRSIHRRNVERVRAAAR